MQMQFISDFEGKFMRQHRSFFESFRKRVGMYVMENRYVAVASFVEGYDAACEGGVLVGFREWLIIRLRFGQNLSWPALVLHAAFPDAQSPQDCLGVQENSELIAIETLFDLILEFDAAKQRTEGLRLIYADFEKVLSELV